VWVSKSFLFMSILAFHDITWCASLCGSLCTSNSFPVGLSMVYHPSLGLTCACTGPCKENSNPMHTREPCLPIHFSYK
jgi:hypothetical protein